jgi:hypothetical protein
LSKSRSVTADERAGAISMSFRTTRSMPIA